MVKCNAYFAGKFSRQFILQVEHEYLKQKMMIKERNIEYLRLIQKQHLSEESSIFGLNKF
jgi:hypothetical protein